MLRTIYIDFKYAKNHKIIMKSRKKDRLLVKKKEQVYQFAYNCNCHRGFNKQKKVPSWV